MSLAKFIEIRFADPVSALSLSSDYVCLGTMMGRVALVYLKDLERVPYLLKELSTENITGISFLDQNNFYIAIGDEEVLKYNITFVDSQPNTAVDCSKNYVEDSQHKARCDSCYTMLTQEHLLMIFLNQTSESTTKVTDTITSIYLKTLVDNTVEEIK